ncbi:histidine triad protein [Streptococcus iniae]|uniref:pneumococcal-type histidine triad protein n=1 Tax=Streptococcus iniae TaxID=1346 RepID=UPI000EF67601|nr:pneumococcal-type histidine triad protein [Streptococcus iniae]RLU52203.1 histidine triad protein [Streptococcus iniae]RLU58633.1 histidine triad protein [Streptococcus iniae]RLU60676.1 histidine triad protein [Streptococcus iniae]RLU68835.1 histidine triad protein [Streptococcus iniae]RLU82772.1 histidine triad protein [Streptococcus iniae]
MIKKQNRLLCLTGILLSCSLALSACQSQPAKEGVQGHKKHQKLSKSKKAKAVKSSKKSRNKEISGIDKPTDDGFMLTSESQIEGKTESGIIVKHGDHKHFFFYSDLKGTKWEYLIPKTYKEGPVSQASASSQARSAAGHADDGYVFNPNDIVAEDANGYTVRHGDHYHYILKSSLGTNLVHHISTTRPFLPAQPPVISHQAGVSGLDFRTSDGFLFDGTNISGSTDTGILVKHGNHLHPISFEALSKSKWSYLVDRYKSKGETKTLTEEEEADYQLKRAYLAKGLGIDSSRIKKVIHQGQVGLEYPHEEHTHLIFLKDLDPSKPFVSPEDHILRKEDGESFEQRKERLIKEYMARFQVKREDIMVDGNYMSVRHGDHAHVYKIDPDLPDDPERDVKTESTTLDQETQTVYGPFYTEGSMDNLTRNGVYDKYKVEGIQNIKNFILLTFSTNSHYGDLKINGQKTKRIYYLVRKDMNWEDVNIKLPEAVKEEGRVFKGWNATMPTKGKMEREHQAFYVDFDKFRKKPEKNVYGPGDNFDDFDLSTYVPVRYTTFTNGRLKLNGHVQGGFYYLVNPELTWKEARQQGLVDPEPVPHPNFEFIEYRRSGSYEKDENAKVGVTVNLAAFGTTAPYIGPYVAADSNNPTDKDDPSRHRNFYYHNPENYAAVGFKAEEGGQLVTRTGRSKTLVYLVRKNYSLAQAGILPPWAQADPGYKRDETKDNLSKEELNKPVTSDTVYTMHFNKANHETTPERKESSEEVRTQQPKTNQAVGRTSSWLDEFVNPVSGEDALVSDGLDDLDESKEMKETLEVSRTGSDQNDKEKETDLSDTDSAKSLEETKEINH